jgi:CDP-glycerol glycerophosphotransferase
MSAGRPRLGRVSGVVRAARFEAHARFRELPIRNDTVLYESFAGSGVLCNPEAIFRELRRSSDFAQLRHIWVLDRAHFGTGVQKEFAGDSRVSFVKRDSPAYYRALATSKYLINNATFPPQFAKRAGQVYLNAWHGTPLKAMGFDMPDGARQSANTLRNFVSADYLLSQNPFMTEVMYQGAYKLDGHFQGVVIEEGYPRVDRQHVDAVEAASVRSRLDAIGLGVGERRIVLYAPTWRGDSFADPRDDIDGLVAAVGDLQHRLGSDYVVVLKTHQILDRFVRERPDLGRVLAPSDMPTNLLLGVVDTLITDFSSIFFDFLATGRRILFFTPDQSAYSASRGTYFEADQLPGPVCAEIDEVARGVLAGDDESEWLRTALRAEWQHRFTEQGDGDSSRRIVDIVFRGRREGYTVRSISESTRTSLLVHLGNLASNGITSSALNLLKALPADRFDVTVGYTRSNSVQQVVNGRLIPKTVRQFPREGGMNGTKFQHLRRRVFYRRGRTDAHRVDARQHRLWDDEWQRCFGDSRFDFIVDFSGYSPLWATLLLHSPEARRAIWMHNDMMAEVKREIFGRRPLELSLPAIFGLYPGYDRLAAVSTALARINEQELPPAVLAGKTIQAVTNLVDAERVLRKSRDRPFENEVPLVADSPEIVGRPEWVDALEADDDAVWFVTVGRYTQEKNHARMIRAFAEAHRRHQAARLLIVGHGPLEESLRELVTSLGLDGTVYLTGPLSNPFSVMRAAQCFVLSSEHEGQPMVLLEAAILGLPLVSVDFSSVADALPAGMIHVVAQSDSALAEGMCDFLEGRVEAKTLDAASYNAGSLQQFFDAVGLPSSSESAVVA